MTDIIFNVLPAQGPTIWLPILGWIPVNSPLVGSFLGVIVAFILNYAWQYLRDNHQKFVGEYHIKAELRGIANNLRVGGIPQPIEPVYGADHVKDFRLFGENGTRVVFWYRGFEKYNLKLEKLQEQRRAASHSHNHANIQVLAGLISTGQRTTAAQIEAELGLKWLKRMPDDMNNSGLSKAKFIWYLLSKTHWKSQQQTDNSGLRPRISCLRAATGIMIYCNPKSDPRGADEERQDQDYCNHEERYDIPNE